MLAIQDHEDGEQHTVIQLEELASTAKQPASVDVNVDADVDDEEDHGLATNGRNDVGASDKARLL